MLALWQHQQDLRIEYFPYEPFAARVWELRRNITCYDAWYVPIAEYLESDVGTLDAKLSNAAGPRCGFVLPPGAGT